MGRVRIRGRDIVGIKFSDRNVVPGSKKDINSAKSGCAG